MRPTKEATELEVKLDKLGDDLRRFGYSQVNSTFKNCKKVLYEGFFFKFQMYLHPSSAGVLLRSWGLKNGKRVPFWQKALLVLLYPFMRTFLKRARE